MSRAGLLARITGAATLAAGALLYGNGTSQLQTLAPGAAGRLLRTGGAGVAPTWGNVADQVTGGVAIFSATLTAGRTYTLPNATGTIPLIESANTWTGTQTFSRSTSGTAIFMSRSSDAVQYDHSYITNSVNRWIWRFSGTETGSNVGGDLYLIRRDDAGALLGTTLSIVRSSGQVGFENGSFSLPSITFGSNLNTGLYRIGTNTVGIACGGVAAASFISSSGQALGTVFAVSDTANTAPEWRLQRARVTGTNGQVLNGDRLGTIRFIGTDDTAATPTGATIFAFAVENFTATARGTSVDINVVPIGSTVGSTRARFHHDGGVQFGATSSTSPGLGVTTTSVAIVAGTTTRVGSEAARFAGGTMAAAGATDVIFAAGAGAFGSGTDSTTPTLGAVTVAGGVGIVKSLWVGATVNCVGLSATGTVTLGGTAVAGHTASGNTTHTLRTTTATTAAVDDCLTLQGRSSGTPAAGFGQRIVGQLASSTGVDRSAFDLTTSWVVATDASRTARTTFSAYDATAARECIRIQASGTAAMIGFLGAAAVARASMAAATGTATRTTYDTATVTLPQLAERVKAIIDDLRAYGLEG